MVWSRTSLASYRWWRLPLKDIKAVVAYIRLDQLVLTAIKDAFDGMLVNSLAAGRHTEYMQRGRGWGLASNCIPHRSFGGSAHP